MAPCRKRKMRTQPLEPALRPQRMPLPRQMPGKWTAMMLRALLWRMTLWRMTLSRMTLSRMTLSLRVIGPLAAATNRVVADRAAQVPRTHVR